MKSLLALLAPAALLLAACGGEPAPANTKSNQVSPERLYETQQCLLCHGPGGRGTPGSGPDLRNIDEHWDVDSLVKYLAKPKEYGDSDPRLLANRGKYRMQMPNTKLKEERLRVLAEYILSLE